MNKFTFVIPVYNAEAYLQDCLNSLQSQDYENWEAICVNDGSVDNSLQILLHYSENDKRFKIISQSNRGVSCARNLALKEIKPSSNNWVAFLDSDDFVAPYMLSEINAILNKESDNLPEYIKAKYKKLINRVLPPPTSTTQYTNTIPQTAKNRESDFINPTTPKKCKHGKSEKQNDITTNHICISRDGYFDNKEVGGFIASVIVRSDFLSNTGIVFPEDMKVLEDQLFSIRLALKANRFLVLKKPYYYYYQDPQSQGNVNFNVEDVVKCVNCIWEEVKIQSNKSIRSYFHKIYFPSKIAMIKNVVRNGNAQSLNKDINVCHFLIRHYINTIKSLPNRILNKVRLYI